MDPVSDMKWDSVQVWWTLSRWLYDASTNETNALHATLADLINDTALQRHGAWSATDTLIKSERLYKTGVLEGGGDVELHLTIIVYSITC